MEHRAYIINVITVVFVILSLFFIFKGGEMSFLQSPKEQEGSVAQDTGLDNVPIGGAAVKTVVTPGPLVSEGTGAQKLFTVGAELTRSGIITETNSQRTQVSLKKLTESKKLNASAQIKADDILARAYFEHTSPDGKTVSDLVSAQEYEFIRVGENLALGGFPTDADVVAAWMNSPGHKANVIDTSYTEIGVGVAKGMYKGQMVVVAVQHFGRPTSACPRVDATLRAQIESEQAALNTTADALTVRKAQLDQDKANGVVVQANVDAYNADVANYENDFAQMDARARTYNKQVEAFNTCMSGTK